MYKVILNLFTNNLSYMHKIINFQLKITTEPIVEIFCRFVFEV